MSRKLINVVMQGGGGSAAKLAVNTTWAELKAMRDNSQLTVGCLYRITDYETIISGEDVQSAGHLFDVVVLATDVNMLSEDAMALHSPRDTEGYFASSKLEAWELKYCLDNDTSRFEWASKAGSWIAILNNGLGAALPLNFISENDTTYNGYPYKFTLDTGEGTAEIYLAHLELQDGEELIPNIAVLGDEVMYDTLPITSIERPQSIEGRGVIYQLKDEFRNVCSYDFKNIQFKRYRIIATKENPDEIECQFYGKYAGLNESSMPTLPTGYSVDYDDSMFLYTFSHIGSNELLTDASIGSQIPTQTGFAIYSMACDNIMIAKKSLSSLPLNNNVFLLWDPNNVGLFRVWNNLFNASQMNTFLGVIENCIFNVYIGDSIIGGPFTSNIIFSMKKCFLNWDYSNCHFVGNFYGNLLGNNFNNCYFSGMYLNIPNLTSIDTNPIKFANIIEGTNGVENNKLTINFTQNSNYPQFAGLDSQGNLKIWNPADLVQ